MRVLLGFVFYLFIFFGNNVFGQKNYLILEKDYGSNEIYNIRDALEIGMMQFKIKSVLKPSKEKYEYYHKIIPTLFSYCDKPPGKYKGTSDMHLLGKTDSEDKIIVEKWGEDEVKYIQYWIPYKKFFFDRDREIPDIDFKCTILVKTLQKEHKESYEYLNYNVPFKPNPNLD